MNQNFYEADSAAEVATPVVQGLYEVFNWESFDYRTTMVVNAALLVAVPELLKFILKRRDLETIDFIIDTLWGELQAWNGIR